jgi:hypothetical protein
LAKRAAALVAGAGALVSPVSGTQAATGQTDIDISLSPIVVLHYYSSVSVTLNGTDLLAQTFVNDEQAVLSGGGTLASGSGDLTVNLGMSPAGPTGGGLDAIPMVLQDAWAVRAISSAGNDVQLEIVLDNDTLTGPDGSEITMDNAAVSDGAATGGTIVFPPQGLFRPVVGDVSFTLDVTNAARAGNYSGGVYTLTATSN